MINKHEFEKLEHQAIVAALFRLCDPRRTMDNMKKGDTVQLKSGGPIMTVGDKNLSGAYNCDWFEGAKLMHGSFYTEQLKLADPEAGEVIDSLRQ